MNMEISNSLFYYVLALHLHIIDAQIILAPAVFDSCSCGAGSIAPSAY